MPKDVVSVVVPVYRAERFLDQCIASILGQSLQNLELILVDDESPDRSGDICDAWAARDSRVRVLHQANGGVSAARNAGLRAASGSHIAFVDADDWVSPNMLATLLSAMTDARADVGVCAYFVATPDGVTSPGAMFERMELTRGEALKHLCLPNHLGVMVWNKLFRADLLKNIHFESTPQSQSEDFDLVVKVLRIAQRIVFVPNPMYFYRQTGQSLMHQGTISMSGVEIAVGLRSYIKEFFPELLVYADYLHCSYLVDTYLEICRRPLEPAYRDFLRSAQPVIRSVWLDTRRGVLAGEVTESRKRVLLWWMISRWPRVFERAYAPTLMLHRRLRGATVY